MNKPTKEKLLEKYSNKPVTHFKQLDGFTNCPCDDIMHPDKDGDVLFGGETYELMTGSADIRIFYKPEIDKKTLKRVILKLLDFNKHLE